MLTNRLLCACGSKKRVLGHEAGLIDVDRHPLNVHKKGAYLSLWGVIEESTTGIEICNDNEKD